MLPISFISLSFNDLPRCVRNLKLVASTVAEVKFFGVVPNSVSNQLALKVVFDKLNSNQRHVSSR